MLDCNKNAKRVNLKINVDFLFSAFLFHSSPVNLDDNMRARLSISVVSYTTVESTL